MTGLVDPCYSGFIFGPLLAKMWFRKHGRVEPFFGEKVERWSATDENRPPIPTSSSLGAQTQALTQQVNDQDSDREETTMIEFETPAVEAAYNEVLLWVTQLFGESAWVDDERPKFSLPIGRNGVSVGLQPYGDDGACVDFFSWPVRDTLLPEDAYEYALRTNAQYRFGALNIQSSGHLLVEYVALFEGMTKSTFSELAQMLASTSDEISLELGSRFFGGNLVE